MAGVVLNGGTVGPNAVFGEGCVLTNVTIISYTEFGSGCTFNDCTWVRNDDYPRSRVGAGAEVNGGTLDYVDFAGTSKFSGITLVDANLGGGGSLDTHAVTLGAAQDIETPDGAGEMLSMGVRANSDWCTARCAPGRYIIGNEGALFSFGGADAGSGATVTE